MNMSFMVRIEKCRLAAWDERGSRAVRTGYTNVPAEV